MRLLLLLVCAFPALADDIEEQMKRFTEAFAIVEQNAADPVQSEQAFYQGAIPGMLRRLDPHSVFFDPGQFDQLKKMQESTSKGFGSVVSLLPGRVIVLQTLPGTPSAKSGIAPGDEILVINGYRLDRLEIEQLIQLLQASRQQPAKLDVRRPGNARILSFVLTPEEMLSPSVDRAFALTPGYGYVRVASFDDKTAQQTKEAIESVGGAKLKGLVLDLRNNPGGLLKSAVEMLALFLKPGTKLVTVRGRKVAETTEPVPKGATPYEFPLAVLLNAKSASASEIVAGALQDHDRAWIIGEASFGKGLVQSVYPLSQASGLALTTALYYTPSGRSIQRPLKEEQFALTETSRHPNKEAAEFKTDKGRKVTGGGGIVPDEIVLPQATTRLRAALEASGSFPNFATDFMQKHKVDGKFEVTADMLDDFKVFVSQRGIQPPVGEWATDREFIRARLKQEIFNQALGVEKGDEVEAQRDPQVQRALSLVTTGDGVPR